MRDSHSALVLVLWCTTMPLSYGVVLLSPMLFSDYMKLLVEVMRKFGPWCHHYADGVPPPPPPSPSSTYPPSSRATEIRVENLVRAASLFKAVSPFCLDEEAQCQERRRDWVAVERRWGMIALASAIVMYDLPTNISLGNLCTR